MVSTSDRNLPQISSHIQNIEREILEKEGRSEIELSMKDDIITEESIEDIETGSYKTETGNRLTEGTVGGGRTDSLGSITTLSELRKRKKSKDRRLIDKDGTLRIVHHGLKERSSRFLDDIFTTCVDLRWRYIFIGFTSSFLFSWLGFAAVWHLMFWLHGDLEEEHLPDLQEENGWTPCVYSIHDFSSTFLYSVETQHTIGYGLRGSSHKCPDTIILQCLQSITGVLIQACMAGIVFAKLARPKKRAKTVTFSKMAVISQINGKLRLIFRVANIRNSQLLESHFKAFILGNVVTKEGRTIRHFQTELPLSTQITEDEDEDEQDYGPIFLPLMVGHTIDSSSPLYEVSPSQLLYSKLEVLVMLEGIVEPSGNTVQARTSYLPREILWGHSFVNCVTYANREGVYLIDHGKVDSVMADETPRMSAKRLESLNSDRKENLSDN